MEISDGGKNMENIVKEISYATEKHAVSLLADQIMKKIDAAGSYEEPMVKWKEIAQLAEKHDDCFFALYSNSTLITEEVCEQVQRLGNVTFMLSIEGTSDTNDARRGEGHYAAAMRAMDLLREPIRQMWSHRSPWSICVINVNNMRQIMEESEDSIPVKMEEEA